MNAVGSHIRKLRKQRDLSQEALAEKLNVTRQAVSQWERGNTQPDIDMLKSIAEVMGVDIHEVIYGAKQKTTPQQTPKQRKRHKAMFIVFGSIALVVGVISLILKNSWSSWLLWPDWYTDIYYTYWPCAKPIFYISISLGALYGCSLFWDIRIRSRMVRIILLGSTAAFMLVYLGVFVIRSMFYLQLLVFAVKDYPAIFLLPGIGLFFGLNGQWTEEEITDV